MMSKYLAILLMPLVFTSREYRRVGPSHPEWWQIELTDLRKQKLSDADRSKCAVVPAKQASMSGDQRLANIPLPERSEHWNYLQSASWSPDGKWVLVGSEAGSSTAHFEDYWLLDWNSRTWQYVGGGNDAKWSPDSSKIVWATPRELAPLGKIHVWVVHLVLLDVRTLKQQALTSGVSYEADVSWCN